MQFYTIQTNSQRFSLIHNCIFKHLSDYLLMHTFIFLFLYTLFYILMSIFCCTIIVFLVHFLFHTLTPPIMVRGGIPFPELGQRRSGLLSPSQLVAADFCSGSCLLAQTDTLLFFLFFFCATLCRDFPSRRSEVEM